MKKLFSSIAAFLITILSIAQTSFQDINSELVTKSLYGAATDNNGNVVVWGMFTDSISFGDLQVKNSTPRTPSGTQTQAAAFISKRSSSGNVLWVNKIDLLPLSNYSCAVYINSLATDASGNIVMTGLFWGKIKCGNTILTSTPYAPGYIYGPGYSTDMFVAELSPNGNFLWANLEGYANEDCVVNGNEMGISVSSDNAGNVYATGRLYPKIIKNTGGTCTGNSPVAAAAIFKYSPAGVRLWNRQYTCPQPSRTNKSYAFGWRIVSDGLNTYTQGIMYGDVKFGGITLNTGSDTTRNTFIVKLDANGNPSWAKNISNGPNGPNSMVIDNGNLYLTGGFGPGTINFGGPTLTTSVSGTGYLAKYNLSGACTWATLPGIQSPNGNLIVNGANGNLAILRDYTLKEYSTTNGANVDSTVSSNVQNSKLSGNPRLMRSSNGYIIAENLQGSYDYAGITITSTQPLGSNYYDMIVVNYSTLPPPIARHGNIISEPAPNKIILYPNPSSNQITIHNNDNQSLGMISIYDGSGKMVYQKFIGNSQTTIDVEKFVSGIYYFRSDQMIAALKFVKQ